MKHWTMRTLLLMAVLAAAVRGADTGDFAEIQGKIVSFTLDNGLTVILCPRGGAPVIACVAYVKAGSVDEHAGITGIAHQLEHLAFKGTPTVGTRDFAAEQAVLREIDAACDKLQEFEQKLPSELRDSFLTLVAQASGSQSNAGQLAQNAAILCAAWEKAGFTVRESEKQALGPLLAAFAEKVAASEKYVEANEYAAIISRNGGAGLNAFTSADCTVYHVLLPSNKLELWAALESDRFMNTVPRQLEKEKQVVLEERNMRTESNPSGQLYESLLGAAFRAHPYGVSVIGHRSDILGCTRKKVMDFYRRHYVPQNTIVAVAGNFDTAAARKTLTDYFGRIPAGKNSEQPVTVEPAQTGERRVEIEFAAQPVWMAAFHVPERNHPDTAALVVLDQLISAGRASRLQTQIVKTEKAASAGCWIGPGDRFPRLFFFSAEPLPGRAIDTLEADMLAAIESFKTQPPSSEELARVISGHRAGVLRELRSNLSLAQELADYQALNGDWHELFRELRRITDVKPEQVTAAAQKYLTKQNRTLARIVSTNAAPAAAPGTVLGLPVK